VSFKFGKVNQSKSDFEKAAINGSKNMKSPAKLREELNNAIANIKSIQKYLKGRTEEKIAGVGAECMKTSAILETIIDNNKLPESYKVAVVGRFKAGKSSFVNELLEIKLAGEDTSPETAAVTTFTYGTQVEAKINLIDKGVWEEQKRLFHDDPKNIDAHRAKMWESFSKPRKNAEGTEERFDLAQIENELLNKGATDIVIKLDESAGKSAEKKFREDLKTYTSGNKPYHCLVSSINITTPSLILKDGIELVDTPGLGDTERFRVSLTEQSVEDVDAILLLTKSGVAYGQEEKDFLLSILRKGSVKQLMIVITQVDQTYDQHVKAAKSDDDDPESIETRIKKEKRRIREEISRTLDELSGADTSVTRAYLDQFSSVDILFTSVMAHRDFSKTGTSSVVLAKGDPGGLITFKNSLSNVLSTESRTSAAASHLLSQSKGALDSLAEVLEAKVSAIKNTKNGEEVERRLTSFRNQFNEICKGIETELKETFVTFKESTENRLLQQKNNIENITLKAEKELNKFRTNDVAKHWRTRRGSNWGYMFDLQSKVANRIFPSVQEMLESHVEDFSTYVRRHERKISKLTKEADIVASQLDLGQFSNFDIKKKLKESTASLLEHTEAQIIAEQDKIIKLLDSFVTEEVEEKITNKRRVVADIWGRGTTSTQQTQVNAFYDEIESILSEALVAHLTARNYSFASILLKAAEHAPKETFQEIDVQLESAISNLKQAAEMTLDGQKDQAEKLIKKIMSEVKSSTNSYQDLLSYLSTGRDQADDEFQSENAQPTFRLPEHYEPNDWTEKLLDECKVLFATFNLKDGESGWPFSKILDSKFFLGSEKIRIVEPYLFKHHQLRNLKELLLQIVETSKPKLVEVFTFHPPLERLENNKQMFDELSKEVFKQHGITFDVSFHESLHDRFIFSDAGYIAKLGRGLDIYKPSAGLASHRQESRKVRACDITILKSTNS
jgi:signal recognition particle receptor subunit beta